MPKDYDLITFGEAMVRLSSSSHMRLEAAMQLDVSVGGAEWNVAVNAASLGLRTAWVSRLVDVWSGRLITNTARFHGVDCSHVVWVPFDGVGRVRNGFYHLEIGAGPRASSVTYDRGHSAVSLIAPDEVDWKALLARARWLHCSGITPALSETLAETVVAAFRAANELGVRTSYDLNYRGKLWTPEQARETHALIVPHVKVLIGNEEDFEKVLGFKVEGVDESLRDLPVEGYKRMVQTVVKAYPNIQAVGTTLREVVSGLINNWSAILYYDGQFYESRRYERLEIEDRVGGGDGFASGFTYGFLTGMSPQECVEFGAANGAMLQTTRGDTCMVTLDEVIAVTKGATARIKR